MTPSTSAVEAEPLRFEFQVQGAVDSVACRQAGPDTGPRSGHFLTQEFLGMPAEGRVNVGPDCVIRAWDHLLKLEDDASFSHYVLARPGQEYRRLFGRGLRRIGRPINDRSWLPPSEPCTLQLPFWCVASPASVHFNGDELLARARAGGAAPLEVLALDKHKRFELAMLLAQLEAAREAEQVTYPGLGQEAAPGWGGPERLPTWEGTAWRCAADASPTADHVLPARDGWVEGDVGDCRWLGVWRDDQLHYVVLPAYGAPPVASGVWTLAQAADVDDRLRWAAVLRSADDLPTTPDVRTTPSPWSAAEAEAAFQEACSRHDWRLGVWAVRAAEPERLHGLDTYQILRQCPQ
jgi:hypothetical protein